MKWHEIQGWFNEYDAQVYDMMVSEMISGHILEIGAYKGRSTMCLCEIIRKSGKDIKVHVVDTFAGDAHIGEIDTYKEFMANMEPYKDIIGSVRRGLSTEIALENKLHYNGIYIDASHDYKSVKADIEHWLPFLSFGGIMGGHDYNWRSVKNAVDEQFQDVTQIGNSWLVYG